MSQPRALVERTRVMPNVDKRTGSQATTAIVSITADERTRERALRDRLAGFWRSASGDPRAVYDAFIAASPPDRAARAGVSVGIEIWEGMHHVFQLDVAHLESGRHALDRAARFLRDALNL